MGKWKVEYLPLGGNIQLKAAANQLLKLAIRCTYLAKG